jgi:hypothetical protein
MHTCVYCSCKYDLIITNAEAYMLFTAHAKYHRIMQAEEMGKLDASGFRSHLSRSTYKNKSMKTRISGLTLN